MAEGIQSVAGYAGLPSPQFIKPGRVRIAFYCIGPRNGVPLVICHGMSASALQFADDAEFFAAKGYRVILPDLRGHGRSGSLPNPRPADFAVSTMAADVVGVLDALNIRRYHWVGNSLGGIIGLSLMDAQAERMMSFASFGTLYTLKTPKWAVRMVPLGAGLFGTRFLAWLTARFTSRNPRVRKLIRYILRTRDPKALSPTLENLGSYDYREAALRYAGPILLIRGGRDRAVNQGLGPTLEAMEGRENFALVEVKRAGHCAQLDAPEEVRAAILEHLEGAGPRSE